MSYYIQYNSADHLIEIRIHGPVMVHEFQTVSLEAVRLAQAQNCFRLLNDFREANTLGISLTAIYQLPQLFAEAITSVGLQPTRFKRATVFKAAQASQANFHETVMVNRGHNLRVFEDIDEAKAWLLQDLIR